jgi:GTP-binding protein
VSAFVDEAQLHVKAGNGGAGAVSFRREAHVAMGGPDGGDGGRGGDVWLEASPNQSSLLAFRDHPHRRAADGRHGQGKRRHGARGEDLVVAVPVGTTVRELGGAVVADLAVPGARWRAARGGRGGHGNARFAANQRRAPAFAEQGEPGEEHWYDLELRLMADVALVGFPNAGKSTLISVISAAKPKIADYPFTTLEPHLGVVRAGGPAGADFVVADIPGLVEGAAEGRGLGHRFLRHVERARALVVLVDLAAADGASPEDQLGVLLAELGRYRAELLERPRLVVGTKADLVPQAAGGSGPFDLAVSAATGAGVSQLVGQLATLVDRARRAELVADAAGGAEGRPVEPVVLRPEAEEVAVERSGPHHFVVTGRGAVRAVALSDLTGGDAMAVVQRRLRRLGVERALVRAGIADGDLVEIGPLSFTYHRDEVVEPGAEADRRPAAARRARQAPNATSGSGPRRWGGR